MTQTDFGTIDANTKSGTDLATDLNAWRDSVHSGHSGTSRPSYAVAGMIWVDNSSGDLKAYLYDGTNDTLVFELDAANQRLRFGFDTDGDSYLEMKADDSLSLVLGGTTYNILNPSRAGILAALNQSLATTESPTFAGGTFTGNITLGDGVTIDGRDPSIDGPILDKATLNDDADLSSGVDWVSSDTNMSNDPNKVPLRSAVKAAIDDAVTGVWDDQGGYDASTNTPDLDTSPSASIKKGWLYTVTAAGVFFTENLEVGDTIVAAQDAPTQLSHWTVVQKNLDAASIKTEYESNSDTNAFTDAEKTAVANIEQTADNSAIAFAIALG